MPSITLRTRVAIAASKRATSSPSMPPVCAGPPALLNRQSIFPNFSTASRINACICASSVTSVCRKRQLAPSFFASASPSGTRRPAMTISAPSATKISAVRSPMPLVAPVITATFPSSFPILLSFPDTRGQQPSHPKLRSLELILPAGSSQGELGFGRSSAYFRRGGHFFGARLGLNSGHEETDRRIPARLAGDLPAVSRFLHRILRPLPLALDRRALGAGANPP